MHNGPYSGLWFSWMTRQEAERFDRRVYGVAENVRLGWTPYAIRVQTPDVLAHTAFVTLKEFRRWLGRDFRPEITGGFKACRTGRIVRRGGA